MRKFFSYTIVFVVFIVLQIHENLAGIQQKAKENQYAFAGRLMKGPPPQDCYTAIDPVYYKTDVNSLMRIKSAQDISEKRKMLIRAIWKSSGFPSTKLPEKVTVGVASPLPNLANLARTDSFIVSMHNRRFSSLVYLFHPVSSTNRLAIFHQGHSSELGAYGGENAIQFLLKRGYTVFALYMPLYGPNAKPPLTTHDQLGLLESSSFCPLQLFMEPIAVALNYARQHHTYRNTTILGISGGGWAATLYAAIDPSVQFSYPVAGTLPLYLSSWPCAERRCWEDSRAHIYSTIDYTDLYLLGAYGAGRKQIQVLNQFDSCCFYGIGYRTYEAAVKKRLASIGPGFFDVLSDTSFLNEHKVSQYALRKLFSPNRGRRKASRAVL